jgi:hypothetical protein
LARGLLLDETLDVDDVLETVDGGNLALTALVNSTGEDNLVILSDGEGADLGGKLESDSRSKPRHTYTIFLTELLAQRRTHDGTSDARRGIVMSLARLSPRGVEGYRELDVNRTRAWGAIFRVTQKGCAERWEIEDGAYRS